MMDPNEISVCERMIMRVLWDAEEDLDLMTVTARVKESSVRSGSSRR